MSTLLEVIEQRLLKEGLNPKMAVVDGINRTFSRSQVPFPQTKKLYTLEDYLVKEEEKHEHQELIFKHAMLENKINALASFFTQHSHIDLANFSQAKKLFFDLFDNQAEFKEKFLVLSEELDKKTDKFHRYGKVLLSSHKQGKLLLERNSYELGQMRQYISMDFDTGDFLSYVTWTNNKPAEIVCVRKHANQANPKHSEDFDAQVWKSFNSFGLDISGFRKTIGCIERNHLNLESFIEKVNHRDIFNLMQAKLIVNPEIKTNGKDTCYFDFETNLAEKVSIKITKRAASLQVS